MIASVAQKFRFSLAEGHAVEPIGLLTCGRRMVSGSQPRRAERLSWGDDENSPGFLVLPDFHWKETNVTDFRR